MYDENSQIVKTLNHLISIAEDGKQGYKNAALDVKDSSMRTFFEKHSRQRGFYIVQLKQEINKLGGTPQEKGSSMGALHQTWMELKSLLTSGNQKTIIQTCLTGESIAAKKYRNALKNNFITHYTRSVVEEQLLGIERTIREMKLKISEK